MAVVRSHAVPIAFVIAIIILAFRADTLTAGFVGIEIRIDFSL